MEKPIADIFTWPADEPALIGTECTGCAAVTFPTQERCPRCGGDAMQERLLPRRGRLVSWTTQGFPPIVPYAGDATGKSFKPFGVGLVELDDVVRVEARLTESDPAHLIFDAEVELRIVPFYKDDNGDTILTFAFAPVADAAGRPTADSKA